MKLAVYLIMHLLASEVRSHTDTLEQLQLLKPIGAGELLQKRLKPF
jgi:hypothetical protein